MIRTILLATILIIMAIPITADARHSHGRSSSSFSIGFNGSNGAVRYSQQNYSHPSFNYQRTVIQHGGGYYGYRPSHPIYRPPINGYGHIHRQEGRRYINDYPCVPVVVVPAKHHRHYRGCGCRY
jgi:hypothetical protein